MKPIAIFYHVYMGGGVIPAAADNCLRICMEQLDTLNVTGLVTQSNLVHVGVSGSKDAANMVKSVVPWPKVSVMHNEFGVGELPTMAHMQYWCKDHPGYAVLYFHTKGAIHGGSPVYERWRYCMENVVLWRWRECVADISDRGIDMAGAHWLKPQNYPFIGPLPYWAGNFWWASSDFINTLPTVEVNADRYQAEVWIGKSRRAPRVHDYAPHFPMTGCR